VRMGGARTAKIGSVRSAGANSEQQRCQRPAKVRKMSMTITPVVSVTRG
jgi:hypothetical protein